MDAADDLTPLDPAYKTLLRVQLAIAALGCLPRQSWWSERANADKQASAETSPVGPA